MRESWKEVIFGDTLEIPLRNGINRPSSVRGIGYKMINMGELFANNRLHNINMELVLLNDVERNNFKVDKFDLLFARQSIVAEGAGKCSIVLDVDDITCFESHIIRARIKNGFSPLFFYYLFQSDYGKALLSSIRQQGVQAGIRGSDLQKIKLKVPIFQTQIKIASILSRYDDLIENNQKRIKILEEMAQQTYEEWFVRMRFPGYETAVFDENGLPEGWERKYFKEVLNFKTGKLDSNALSENGEYDFYTCAKEVYKTNTYCFDGEAVLLGGNNATGDFALFYAKSKFDAYQRTYIVTTKTDELSLVYVFQVFATYLTHFKIVSSGASTKFLTMRILDKTKIIVPSNTILRKFNALVEPCHSEILNLKDQNQRLREARDILLPRLMMGMIDVSESSVQVDSVEAKPTDAKVIPLEQPKKEASKEFKEAVLIACLTERFGSEKFPLGRKRYTKLSYLFHRYSDNKIQDYLRKAAGPYNPKTKYGGPEKIALNNKYIQNWKSDNKLTGFVSAEKIEDAKTYFSNYWQIADLDWLTAEFKFKSNDELELLATVDNSLVELSKKNLEFTSTNVLDIIKSEKEWEAKLERTIFSDANLERAIGFLRGVLEYNN